MRRGIHCYQALLVARAWLANNAEWHSVSASIDALQTGRLRKRDFSRFLASEPDVK